MTPVPTETPLPAAGRGRPSAGLLLVNLACLGLVLWTAVDMVRLGLEVRGARVVALHALPFWPFYLLAGLATAGLGVYVAAALVRRQPAESRAYRLLPIAGLVFLVVHFLVLPPSIPPVPLDWMAAGQLLGLQDTPILTEDGALPRDPTELSRQLSQIPPPYLRDGEQPEIWPLVVHEDCQGPVTELPAGIEPGTLIACVAADHRSAWLSLAGTGGTYTGPATLFSAEGKPFSVRVQSMRQADLPAMPSDLSELLGEGPDADPEPAPQD